MSDTIVESGRPKVSKGRPESPLVAPQGETSDTIVAVATPPGQGGVAIVRISGPQAERILNSIFFSKEAAPASRRLVLGWVGAPDDPIDEAMGVLMRAPRSYTREDVAEIHCHGAPWTVRATVRLAVEAGARPAEPGEFTRRAFENGRIDLAQAEAVMALIGAQGERAARDALRQMRGGASKIALEARAECIRLLAGLEAALDFPEEFDTAEERAISGGLREDAASLAASLRAVCNPRAEKLLREGLEVVIAGRPNAGKSTLLNALLGEERAIVTDLPGTTRDTLTERLELDGLVVQLTDTAGLREGDAMDAAEAMGMIRARAALERADVRLIVVDASVPLEPEDKALLAEPCEQARIVVLNKCDKPAARDEYFARTRREGGRRATAKPSGRARRHEILLKQQQMKENFALRGDQRAFRSPQFAIVAPRRSVAHWASASLHRPPAALGSAPFGNLRRTMGVSGQSGVRIIQISALTGQGIPALLDALREQAALPGAAQASLTRERHIAAATRAAEALEDAVAALDAGLPSDLAAIDLRRALEALGGITGETLSEDVIDAIFANFCVGK